MREEMELNWNRLIRQTHRWLSIAFTLAVILNLVFLMQKEQVVWVGLLALFPLIEGAELKGLVAPYKNTGKPITLFGPRCKKSSFLFSENNVCCARPASATRGVSRSSRTLGAGCGGRVGVAA